MNHGESPNYAHTLCAPRTPLLGGKNRDRAAAHGGPAPIPFRDVDAPTSHISWQSPDTGPDGPVPHCARTRLGRGAQQQLGLVWLGGDAREVNGWRGAPDENSVGFEPEQSTEVRLGCKGA